MEEIKVEKSKWSVLSWSVFLEGVLYICQAKKCCSVAKTAVCLFDSKTFCSNPFPVQLNKLSVFAFKSFFDTQIT